MWSGEVDDLEITTAVAVSRGGGRASESWSMFHLF